jgi:excisionase family DNA binding protein
MDALVSVQALMEYLGCSRISVYRRCKGGELPFEKIGGRVMFRRSDIEKWIARNTHRCADASVE